MFRKTPRAKAEKKQFAPPSESSAVPESLRDLEVPASIHLYPLYSLGIR
jgi:hypothetical protein